MGPQRKHEPQRSLYEDIVTCWWITSPKRCLQFIFAFLALWTFFQLKAPEQDNPIDPFFKLSYRLPPEAGDDGARYGKGALDICFLSFWTIVFSLIRQTVTLYVVAPVARKLGIRGESKTVRFMEQGYAFIYFTVTGSLGLYVMSRQGTWWYRTEQFWLEYPHWRMRHEVKFFYLFQFAYWYQLIPEYNRTFDTWTEGWWVANGITTGRIPSWMRYHIFAPIFLLGLVNIFWSALIWRIALRVLAGSNATDIREEGEDEEDDNGGIDNKKTD